MQVKDIMTSDPTCCTADSSLAEVARMMVDNDCGEIPVVESQGGKKPVGVVTDRDIVVRTIGAGKNPMDMTAGDCMSTPAVTIKSDASFKECKHLLRDNQIRRIPVVDDSGAICGIVALADVAKYASDDDAGDVLQDVSVDTGDSSSVR